MKLPVQIVFRDMAPLPSLEGDIRAHAAKLDHWGPEVTSCHVAVEAEGNRHRTGHTYRVHLHVQAPDGDVAVSVHPGDPNIHRAVRAAFDSASRQLEEHVRRRRQLSRAPQLVRYGRVLLLSDEGTGLVLGDDGQTYHFDRSHVVEPGFERLAVGQAVGFLPGVTRAGREARRIAVTQRPADGEAQWP